MLFKSLIALLALCRGVWATNLRRKVQKDNHHHLHFHCFTNTSDCDFLMSSVIMEKTREVEADEKAGRKTPQLKNITNFNAKLPGEGSAPDWWDEGDSFAPTRLSDDCEEPEDPPQNVGGWGPDKVYCCHTAKALVEDLEVKKEHCDSDPPVDCWKSLREVLPNYIAHFTKRRDYLCRTTTTTTITHTTTTITTTTPYPGEGDLQLQPNGGAAGRLEIRHNGAWGTICSDNFEDVDAQVACKQMGLPGGRRVDLKPFGEGKNSIWLDEVDCTGSEGKLMECHHPGYGVQNCVHAKDVAIECKLYAPAPAPIPDWCIELCKEHTQADQSKCESLCAEIHARTVHRDDCPEAVQEAGAPAGPPPLAGAPAPSNK